ncbi:MAG: acyltransferase, partial [Tepidisphaeraceae bacterium]
QSMKRVAQLDGVRGIAILLVLLWHYWACEVRLAPHSLLAHVNLMFGITWSGVDLFFVLSGFLITGILLDHRGASNFFRVFYLRRLCRIFPLYFLVLGLYAALLLVLGSRASSAAFHWLFENRLPLWSYATFTQNFFMGHRGTYGGNWLGCTWSLAVEEQFYLVIPLLVYFLPRRAFAIVAIAAVVAAPLLRFLSPGLHAFVDTPFRSDSLLSGALLALLVRRPLLVSWIMERRGPLRMLFAFLLSGAGVMAWRQDYFGVFRHSWLAMLYAAFILIAYLDTEPRLTRLLSSRVLVWFGRCSYGIYLIHMPVSGLLHGLFRHRPPELLDWPGAVLTLVSLAITLALAAASFRFLESPILRLGRRAKYGEAGEAGEAGNDETRTSKFELDPKIRPAPVTLLR